MTPPATSESHHLRSWAAFLAAALLGDGAFFVWARGVSCRDREAASATDAAAPDRARWAARTLMTRVDMTRRSACAIPRLAPLRPGSYDKSRGLKTAARPGQVEPGRRSV